jgi:hypothetical protein
LNPLAMIVLRVQRPTSKKDMPSAMVAIQGKIEENTFKELLAMGVGLDSALKEAMEAVEGGAD